MPSLAQSDSTVTISHKRLVGWAAKRAVADTLIREKARSVARARTVIEVLQLANEGADSTITRLVSENTSLRGDVDQLEGEVQDKDRKLGRMRVWATVGKIAAGLAVVVTALAIVREASP